MPIVCIDPGHGGHDPGAVGPTGLKEKDVTLAVAKKIAKMLQDVDVDVQLTRDTDKHLGLMTSADLSTRAKMANNAKADAFVSIHCNAAANQTATGTETYHYPNSAGSSKLAGALQKHLVAALGLPDRGVKQANFAVLRETKMPAALVELGFISNPAEGELLMDPVFQARAAQAVARGIAGFLGVKVVDKDRDYKVHPDYAAMVEMARRKGLSAPGPGHDYTQPLSEERFWALVARLLRWQ